MTDRVSDAVRHVAHCSHEARLVASMARDAGEDGVHAAKRAMRRLRRRIEDLQDVKDEAVYYVKREPVKAIGIAAGLCLTTGLLVGWIAGRTGRRRVRDSEIE